MKKYLAMSALLVAAFAQSETAQANGRHCFPVNYNGHHRIICRDVAQQPQQQQSRWTVDQMRRVNFNCTTVMTQFGPRRYCY